MIHVMNLSELIRKISWADVKASLLWLYPDAGEALGEYQRVFHELRQKVPATSPMRISIRTTFREGIDDEPFEEVIGMDGSLNRDQEDFKHFGHAPDSPIALEETAFSLALEPWDKWLGMSIDPETLARLSESQIVAHCLWEMTFHGFTQTQVREQREELDRRVAELDAMTEEERDQKLIPASEVMKRLKEELGPE